MTTCRSCIKWLKITCEIVFYCICWFTSAACSHEISSFPEVLYKRVVLKNLSKFTDKHKKLSSGGVLSKDVLKNFAKFIEKYLCRSFFCNKVADWKPAVRSSHWRCSVKQVVLKNFANFPGENLWTFPVKFTNFSRTIILKKICEHLLLNYL